MTLVRASVLGKNEDIIKVHEPVNHVSQDVVHQGLEDSWCVSEKRHHQVFPVTRRCIERRLPFVPLLDPDKVVGVPQVQLREDGSPLQQFEGRIH